ncbi:MAG TPA: hypothetical protein VK577_17910, partial [Bradyrhizobium sp.]|nr:hypothetical protein [Bradyrhizobium sp.]
QSESGRFASAKLTIEAADPARLERIPCAGLGLRESDSGLFSKLIISARDQLWTSAALAVDGLPVRLRRFRKSHHLIPASPGGRDQGIAVGSHASCQLVSACCVRIKPSCLNLFSENGKVETECPSSKASSIP